ncbi:MAG: hypothetical protein ACLRZ9_03250 [Eubacterium sp.]
MKKARDGDQRHRKKTKIKISSAGRAPFKVSFDFSKRKMATNSRHKKYNK